MAAAHPETRGTREPPHHARQWAAHPLLRGKATLKKCDADLVTLLCECTEDARKEMAGSGQELVVALSDSLHLEADPVRLEQVFANLLANAAKFTPHGGRTEVELVRRGQTAVVEVRDNGRGVSESQRERIFAPFVQDRPDDWGLGIGLPLARGLVVLHGGDISLRSDGRGEGSVFEVRLPLGISDRKRLQGELSGRGHPVRGLRVLVVDDMRDAADPLAELLCAEGADARCAYSGREALERAEEWRPQVALVDIGLADIPGFEVARRLRERGRGMLLIAVTGFGTKEIAVRARDAGFDGRLIKPLDPQELWDLLESHFGS